VTGPPRKTGRAPAWLMWLVKAAIGVGLIVFVLGSGRLDLGVVVRALGTGFWWFLAGVGFLAAVPLIAGLRWWCLLRLAELNVPLKEALRLSSICCFFNTFLPGATGGDVIRIYGAARTFPKKRAEAVLTIVADRITGLFSMIILALVVLALNYKPIIEQPVVRRAAVILAVTMAVGFLVTVFLLSRRMSGVREFAFSRGVGPIRRILMRFDRALEIFRGRHATLWACIGVSFATHLCTILTLYAGARTIGELNIPFTRYLFLAPLCFAVNAIPLSPGGAGQGESFADVLFQAMGSQNGAEIFLVYRIILMLAWLPGAFFYLTGSIRPATVQPDEKQPEAEHVGDV
jgi:uncharacterized protein (TIRG00374 family)